MKRIAVFVDAGYFWVQLCNLINGNYSSRGQVQLNYEDLRLHFLSEIAAQFPNGDLLRIYWYDGPGMNGKTNEHTAIDQLDDFKLRLGTRNGVGQQKGVDGLIIADLISLTQQKAITHALLVSGDSDITPGVIAAQSMGLRVHLLSLGASAATSPYLAAEVDYKRSWGSAEAIKFASSTAMAVAAQASIGQISIAVSLTQAIATPNSIAQIAFNQVKLGPNSLLFSGLKQGVFNLPREIDGELLAVGRAQLGRALTIAEKLDLRKEFRAMIV